MKALCHRMILLIALLGITIAGPAGRGAWTAASKPNKARSTWMTGYQKIVEADKAEAAEGRALALQLYTEALSIFRKVNEEFPGWNSEVVQFRINYCEERIRRLELTVDVKRSDKSKADLITELQKLEGEYETRENTLKTEKSETGDRLAEANTQINELKTQIQALEQKNRVLEKHQESFQKKQTELENANEKLTQSVANAKKKAAKLDEELARPRADKRELRGLREETQVLKSALADRTHQLDVQKRLNLELMAEAKQAGKTTALLTKKEESLEQAQQEIKELQASLGQLQNVRLRGVEKKNQALIADLEEKETELQELNNSLASKDKKISELQGVLEKSGAKELKKLEQQLAGQKSKITAAEKEITTLRETVIAKEEAEKRLIAEKKKRLEQEQNVRRKKREREEKLHSLLKTGSSAETDKDMEKAIWNYKKILEMEPRHKDALARLGFLFAERGQDVEAERYLLRAFELQPDNTDILLRLGRSQLKQAKIPMAIASLSRGTILAPKNPDFRHYYGIACRSMGWASAAETQFRECLALDNANRDAAFNLAVLLATLDNPRLEEARKWYKKAKELGAEPNAQLEAVFENM